MLSTNQTYSDLPFFISKNPFTNDLNLIKDLSAIRQSLKNIILTNLGERSFDYNFGANIYNYLFENLSVDIRLEIQANIATNVKLYEPRVEINEITLTEDGKNNSINITIEFGIIGTKVTDKLTVTLIRTR